MRTGPSGRTRQRIGAGTDVQRWWLKQSKREVLVDFYSKAVVRVWLMMDPTNGLDLEEVGEESVGEPPEWLVYERENQGWDDILGISYTDDKMLRWGLENGIAPGQLFLVELPHPRYSKHWTDCGYEYDVDYAPSIVRVRPMKPSCAARAFEREWSRIAEGREWRAEREKEQRYLVRTDVKSMFVQSEVYFSSGQSLYDDMEMPSGVRYSLCSNANIDKRAAGRWVTATLVSGEDDGGDYKKAFERLVECAVRELPGLCAEVIRTLPQRSANW